MRAVLLHLATAAAAVALAALLGWLLARALDDYSVRILIVVCINAILVSSMGLGNGFTGVFSLGHVGFVAVGAYASGILSLPVATKAAFLPHLPAWLAHWSLPFLPATLAAGLLCVVLALIVFVALKDNLLGDFVNADPDTLERIAESVLATDFLRERAVVFDSLSRIGVHCLDVAPRSLSVALLKMEGYTVEEIGERLGYVPRTIKRKLRLIRGLWEQELTP